MREERKRTEASLSLLGELEKCYPSTSYHTEHQNRSKTRKALQVSLTTATPSSSRASSVEAAAVWQTGDISDVMRMSSDPAMARLESAGMREERAALVSPFVSSIAFSSHLCLFLL